MKCQPVYPAGLTLLQKELLGKIFVLDQENRISLSAIQKHGVFQSVDWSLSMKQRFDETNAPFVPSEAAFNEMVLRNSV